MAQLRLHALQTWSARLWSPSRPRTQVSGRCEVLLTVLFFL